LREGNAVRLGPRLIGIAALAGIALAACGTSSSTPATSATTAPVGPALRTIDLTGKECAGFGLSDATLHGAADDPRIAWVAIPGHDDRPAVFPLGYAARFAPALEVLAPDGTVAFREGDAIVDVCGQIDGALILTK
jgi:hypothetical protein